MKNKKKRVEAKTKVNAKVNTGRSTEKDISIAIHQNSGNVGVK